jgi:hypothetical protein
MQKSDKRRREFLRILHAFLSFWSLLAGSVGHFMIDEVLILVGLALVDAFAQWVKHL